MDRAAAAPPDDHGRRWVRRARAAVRLAVLTLAAGVVGLVSGFGTASAYFQVTGLGSGTGESGASGTVSLEPGAITASLYPGSSAGVTTTVSNPDSHPATIAALALDTGQGTGGFAVDADHAGCALTTFSFATQTNGGAGWTVPANGSLPISLPSSVTATAATANACQGATLTVHLRATT